MTLVWYYTARSKAAYWGGRNASGESVESGVYFYQLRAAAALARARNRLRVAGHE